MRYLLLCHHLLLSVILNAGNSEFRTFTDPQGREMEAKLTLVSGDDVYIERHDGMATKVDISIFSKEDQTFIRDWEKKDALTSGINVRFKTHLSDRSGFESSGGIERKQWKEGYEIVVKNDTGFDMKDVHIKYLILKYEDAMAAQKRSEGEIRQLEGKAKIGTIGKYSEGLTKTDQFPMLETRLAPGYSWADGGKEKSEDRMEGIWVKIYSGDLLVTEATKPENLARTMTWE